LLIVTALAMRPWNDEVSNVEQAVFLTTHGLREWIRNYRAINAWMGPHHPPLLALMYGGFYALVGPHLLAGRLLNIGFSLTALAAAARLVRRVTDAPTAALASLCWVFYPLWLYNGAAAIMEGPFLLIFLLTADAVAVFLQTPSTRRALAVGGWLALALLCRYNVALLAPGVALLLLSPEHRAVLKKPGTWWLLGLPALLFAPFLVVAAKTGLLMTQAGKMKGMALLLNPGGMFYLKETLLPLWPLHAGAHVIAIAALSLLALWKGAGRNPTLLALGGGYLLFVLILLPNPRYLLPAVPFLSAGAARALQVVEQRGGGAGAAWAGIAASALTLAVVVITAATYDGYYPFY
jgi:4-amino-4-deoxy-L-arabinose transferase-like glycosyltransferase